MVDWLGWVGVLVRAYVVALVAVGALSVLRALTPFVLADVLVSTAWFALGGYGLMVLLFLALGYWSRE